jgi:uncharacterized protein
MKLNKFLFLIFIVLNLQASSFDCTKASSKLESIICSSYIVGILDERLSARYQFIKKQLDEAQTNGFINEQKKWLTRRDKSCKGLEKVNAEECLKSLYKERIEYFDRKYKKLFTVPPKEELINICTQIAKEPEMFVAQHSIKDQEFDINNDGVIESVETGTLGTMRMPYYSYVTSVNKKREDATGQDSEWEDDYLYGLAHIQSEGHIFHLTSIDDFFKKPAYLSYITPFDTNIRVCKFSNEEKNVLAPNTNIKNAKNVCEAVENKTNINYIELTKDTELKREDILESPREYYLGNEGLVDYDNDGVQNEVILIGYASGAGRGCSFQYFEEIVSKEKRIKMSKSSYLLGIAQRDTCGSEVKFFEYQNKIYIEEVSRNSHKIEKIEDGKIDTICDGQVNIVTELIYVYE